MASSIYGTPVPTGGVISLAISASGSAIMIGRSTAGSGGPFTTIYSGVPDAIFIDAGDGLPTPLASGTAYTYQLSDSNGNSISNTITPALTLNIQQEPLTPLLLRILQAGITNLTPPQGVSAIPSSQVLQAMPLVGLPPLPIVTLNLDLEQQQEIPVGQAFEVINNATGGWSIFGFMKRVYRISILANNTTDRDFYRDAIVAILISILRTVLTPIGLDVRHKYQVSAGQTANDLAGMGPGFYWADVMFEFEGTFSLAVTPGYGLISNLSMTAQTADGTQVTAIAPSSGMI